MTVEPVVHDDTAAAPDVPMLAVLLGAADLREGCDASEELVLHPPTAGGAGCGCEAGADACGAGDPPPPNQEPKKLPKPEPDWEEAAGAASAEATRAADEPPPLTLAATRFSSASACSFKPASR